MNTTQSHQPRALIRRSDDKMIGGVCSGIASYAGLDPALVRAAVAVAAVFTFPVVPLLYLLMWAIVPKR
jgi:phage shock protein C